MVPKINPPAGKAYTAACLLLAPSISALSLEEFEALIVLMRESNGASLVDAYRSFTTANAIMTTAALQTRFAAEPGMSEAAEVVFVASMYLDNGMVMPPQSARYQNSWLETYFPDIAQAVDQAGDLLQNLVLAEDNSVSAENPPSLLNNDAPMYCRACFDALDNAFKATDSGRDVSRGGNVAQPQSPSMLEDLTRGAMRLLGT